MDRELIRNKYYILAGSTYDFVHFCNRVGLNINDIRVEWVTNTAQVRHMPNNSEIYKGDNYLNASILKNYWFRTRVLIGELKVVDWRG